MNWRLGFFRAWVLLAVVWLAGSVAIFAPQGWAEWQKKATMDAFNSEKFIMLVPTDCSLARGRGGTLKEKADYEKQQDDGKCWYEFQNFRRLYPEYKDLDDETLQSRTYEKAGIPLHPAKPFWVLGQFLIIGVGVPLVLLATGASLGWVLRGFQDRASA